LFPPNEHPIAAVETFKLSNITNETKSKHGKSWSIGDIPSSIPFIIRCNTPEILVTPTSHQHQPAASADDESAEEKSATSTIDPTNTYLQRQRPRLRHDWPKPELTATPPRPASISTISATTPKRYTLPDQVHPPASKRRRVESSDSQTLNLSPVNSGQVSQPGRFAAPWIALGGRPTSDPKILSIRDSIRWPPPNDKLLDGIKAALSWQVPQQKPPRLLFKPTLEAAEANFELLRQFNFDLQAVLLADDNNPTRPGSEFRPTNILQPIFGTHPLWEQMASILTVGTTCIQSLPSNEERLEELSQQRDRGNHKSAKLHCEALLSSLLKETERAWQLPLPLYKLDQIPNACLGPCGVVEQVSFDMHGQTTTKLRITHDQSFEISKGLSFNNRINAETLPTCMYGHAFRRILHNIVATQESNDANFGEQV
jgi:hypothetical protein